MDKRFWVWLTSVPSLVSDSEVTNEEQLLLENKVKTVQGKVLINDGTPGGTTMAYQKRITYPDGSMKIFQENLTTGEISFQGINSSGQQVFETSLTPHEANTLIGANSSSKMLVGNGAVSQSVISRVSYQTGNNSLAYQNRFTDSSGNMGILQKNLTTGEISLQKINPLGQRISETSFTPYPANALIGTSTSALTQISYQIPVMNGATRAMQYSSQWGNASLTEAINRFAPNAKPVENSKGKVIYSNNETGVSVVYDKNGNYFRIEDTTKPRGRNYLDINGNDMNNEVVNGKQRGRNRVDYQKVTHFNNTD